MKRLASIAAVAAFTLALSTVVPVAADGPDDPTPTPIPTCPDGQLLCTGNASTHIFLDSDTQVGMDHRVVAVHLGISDGTTNTMVFWYKDLADADQGSNDITLAEDSTMAWSGIVPCSDLASGQFSITGVYEEDGFSSTQWIEPCVAPKPTPRPTSKPTRKPAPKPLPVVTPMAVLTPMPTAAPLVVSVDAEDAVPTEAPTAAPASSGWTPMM